MGAPSGHVGNLSFPTQTGKSEDSHEVGKKGYSFRSDPSHVLDRGRTVKTRACPPFLFIVIIMSKDIQRNSLCDKSVNQFFAVVMSLRGYLTLAEPRHTNRSPPSYKQTIIDNHVEFLPEHQGPPHFLGGTNSVRVLEWNILLPTASVSQKSVHLKDRGNS